MSKVFHSNHVIIFVALKTLCTSVESLICWLHTSSQCPNLSSYQQTILIYRRVFFVNHPTLGTSVKNRSISPLSMTKPFTQILNLAMVVECNHHCYQIVIRSLKCSIYLSFCPRNQEKNPVICILDLKRERQEDGIVDMVCLYCRIMYQIIRTLHYYIAYFSFLF